AFESLTTRSTSECACSRVMTRASADASRFPLPASRLPPGVDDIDVAESRGDATVAHRADLPGLSLPVEEARAHRVARLSADHVHRVPELWRLHLIRDVLEHAVELSALDLVEHLTAELRVVALLVDRE